MPTIVYLDQLGAVGDWQPNVGGRDNTAEMQTALQRIRNSGGGQICFGPGAYYFSKSILLNYPTQLCGIGGSYYSKHITGTTLVFPAGVTGVKIAQDQTSLGGGYSVLRDLQLRALPSATPMNTTTGTFSKPTILEVNDTTSFQTGQIITAYGAGRPAPLYGLAASTVKNSNTITIFHDVPFPGHLLEIGQYVDISENAQGKKFIFGGGAKIQQITTISNTKTTLTLSEVASETVLISKGKTLWLWEDLYAEILAIEANVFQLNTPAIHSRTDTIVEHADAGIYATRRFQTEGMISVYGFQGNGIHVHGNGSDLPIRTNANLSFLGYGVSAENRNGIYFSGTDANAGGCTSGFNVFKNRRFGLVDNSLLGNTWIGLHTSAGGGYRVTSQHARSIFLGCYAEGPDSTYSSFAPSTMILGGTMSDTLGGASIRAYGGYDQRMSNLYVKGNLEVGELDYGDLPNQTNQQYSGGFEPYGPISDGAMTFGYHDKTSGTNSIGHLRRGGGAGAPEWWGIATGKNNGEGFSLLWKEANDTESSRVWIPHGLYLGNTGPTKALKEAHNRLIELGSGPPIDGQYQQGDRIFNEAPSGGDYAGWICVQNGTPGDWKGFGLIES